MTIGVYKITCLVNGKIYIGQSSNVEVRFKDHVIRLNLGKADNKYLQSEWSLYGKENFIFEILEECNNNSRFEKEQQYIINLKTLANQNGYNVSLNNRVRLGMTETDIKEMHRKIGETRKGKFTGKNHHNYGKPMSEEQKKKISESLKGEHNVMFGTKRPEHSKLMQGANNPRARRIICITTNEIFDCAIYAANKYRTTNSNILKCCRSEQKTAGKLEDGTKLVFKFYEEYLKENA